MLVLQLFLAYPKILVVAHLTNAYFGAVTSPVVGKLATSTGLKYNNIK